MSTCSSCGHETPDSKFCSYCGEPLPDVGDHALSGKNCPKCGKPTSLGQKYCAACGSALDGATAGRTQSVNAQIGEIGILRGNIDFSTHIGSQSNFNGPVTIQTQVQVPDLEENLRTGEFCLERKDYPGAVQVLTRALTQDPSHALCQALLALALLKGCSPEVQPTGILRQVEACLQVAAQSSEMHRFALVTLGIIKYDVYLANGIDEGQPSFDQIRDQLGNQVLSDSDRQLLAHVKASRQAKLHLGLDW
jgi:hypothetical protein